jgi:hypothetical protein
MGRPPSDAEVSERVEMRLAQFQHFMHTVRNECSTRSKEWTQMPVEHRIEALTANPDRSPRPSRVA